MIRQMKTAVFSSWDGLPLSLLELSPGEPLGVVQLVHGMCEHKERYLPFMQYLAKRGFVCVIHDHRGHGESVRKPEDLGYLYGAGAEGMVTDVLSVNQWIRRRWPGLPVALLGHSMGSLAVRAFIKEHDRLADLLVVCGSPSKNPALKLGQGIAWLEKKRFGDRHRSKLLEALSFGSYSKKFPGPNRKHAWLSANSENVAYFSESPLCGFTFTDDAYLALFGLMETVYSRRGWACANPSLPVLFVGGSDDPCIGGPKKFAQAIRYLREAGYSDIKGKLYPGMRHEILNENHREKVYRDICSYLQKNCSKRDHN